LPRLSRVVSEEGDGVGIFKQMKDMKATAAAPGMIDQANLLSEQSSQLATTRHAAGQQATAQAREAAAAPAEGPDFEPIAGVSLDLYAEISKALAAYNDNQSQAADVAASKGVAASDWSVAVDGWNARMLSNPSVGQRFNVLYTAA
jgi:hypothetical protein